jgi:cbb3-type cytochrome oxidase subunit 3
MKSWKRRTQFNKKIQKKFSWMSIFYKGDLYSMYQKYRKDEKAKARRFKQEMDDVREEKGDKTYYEDCSYHPCLITLIDYNNDDIKGKSLVDGTEPRSCSLRSCGVVFFTQGEAEERAEYWKQHGRDAYFEKYVYL